MTYKAIRLQRRGHAPITIDKLFEAAFGSRRENYPRKSLMGWRPLAQDPETSIPDTGSEPALPEKDESLAHSSPGVKLYETDSLIVVEVELPPIVEDSLFIEISGDLLIIRGRQLTDTPGGEAGRHRAKLVHRYVQLPIIAEPGKVRARLQGNTVRVTIPKQDEEN